MTEIKSDVKLLFKNNSIIRAALFLSVCFCLALLLIVFDLFSFIGEVGEDGIYRVTRWVKTFVRLENKDGVQN